MSLPHQPPLYGVSSGWPVRLGHERPDERAVPVSTASTATSWLLMRFIIFSSSPTIVLGVPVPVARPSMKNVVLPESPYGSLHDEVVAQPAGAASASSSS